MIVLLLSTATAEPLAPGEEIERAAALHVTNGGFRHVGDAIEGLVPASFPIEDVSGTTTCDEEDEAPLTYELASTELVLTAENVDITTSDGRLDITIYLSLQSEPSDLLVQGDCTFLTDLDEVCTMRIKETSVVAHLGMTMELVDGEDGPTFDVVVDDPTVEMSAINNPLSDCTLADAVDFLLIDDEYGITYIILGLIEPELEGLGADLGATIEDALNQTTIETSVGLGDAEVALALYPTLFDLGDAGLILGLGGTAETDQLSDCVPQTEGSEFADAAWPDFDETAWETSLDYDAGLFLSKDFLDHVLWNVYAGGGLCMDVGELAGDSLSLETDLFAPMFGEEFAALFPESQPLGLQTRPASPPQVFFDDDTPEITVALEDFGLDFSSDLDDREARLFRVAVAMDVGLDPGLTSTALAPELLIDPAGMEYSEPYNELLPEGFSADLGDFLPTIIEQFIPEDVLPVIDLPDFYGLGLQTVFWVPDDSEQWQGGFVLIDVEGVTPMEIPGCQGGSLGCDGEEPPDFNSMLGCDEDGGCGDSGCSDESCSGDSCSGSSCAVHGRGLRIPNRVWVLSFLGLLGLCRRRAD
ncbi:MAG TPA: hypothetical protein QGF58_23800 [Myxococcota bacterium]|nr:hypothetical protein [Myxococcota bacterium]